MSALDQSFTALHNRCKGPMGDRYRSNGWAYHGMYLMAKPLSSTRVFTRESGTLFPSSLRTSARGLLMPSVGAATSPPAKLFSSSDGSSGSCSRRDARAFAAKGRARRGVGARRRRRRARAPGAIAGRTGGRNLGESEGGVWGFCK